MDSLLDLLEQLAFQHWKLTLGIAGIALTFVEMFFPRVADGFENLVEAIGNPKFLSSFKKFDLVVMGTIIACVALGASFLFSIAVTAALFETAGRLLTILKFIFIVTALALAITTVTIVVCHVLSRLFRLLNAITNDRALGSIGLVLLLLLLAGEIYLRGVS